MQYKICAIFFRWQRCKFHVFFIGHKGPSKRANLGWSPRGCRQFVWHLSIPAVFFDGMGSCNINFTVCQCCLGHRRLNFMKPGSCFLICVGKPKRYIYIYICYICNIDSKQYNRQCHRALSKNGQQKSRNVSSTCMSINCIELYQSINCDHAFENIWEENP